ncbi:uncharacterized protein LOC131998395 [Stomoxys calcitrans]|uniref:uncharacterized protein LOC131995963 n=2 Tax=Stomoxys calcitrans TaxID=35570 RepID=UPI0027E29E57|nr:uncharacterized protein LOC131995963 [Stomoxys calcitrans]XP_059224256.1 uncharacterized protein LOC131997359 [Stomoxys calcitrans]XP_059225937.1 uncharacterized protein LOC131998002 [Stomoxys calcitrans]XP_059226665.1 uncharacterized protein LOC131998395 [Stomoxys calcitrans]
MLYVDFFKYINSFDIFFLLETHICADKCEKFSKYFGDFELVWHYAARNSRFGRGIGGCLIGIRKDLKKFGVQHTHTTEQGINVIKIIINGLKFNIIPMYMRLQTWKEEFLKIDSILRECSIENPIIIGDLNVRIGSLQKNIDEIFKETFHAGLEERRSKDAEINSRGRDFLKLCYDHGLVIANGMTNGDEIGEFTFVSTVGTSVNDICAISQELLSRVHRFTVGNKIWSDHMPIILSMIYRSENIPEKLNTLLPKLNWDNRKYFEYQNEINKILTTRRQLSPYSFSEIAEIIQEAHRSIATTTMTFSGREKWFNVTCFNARKKSFEYLDKFRKYASRENREKYVYFNKRYKEICENAKAQYNNRLERKIDEVKDSHDWWKIVRELRNEERCGSIPVKTEDLKNYFQQLLTHTKNFPDIHYAYIHWRDDDLDREICLMEVKKALGKAKLNKAPGEDRVPYEFYKYATDELLQEITCTCNVIFEKGEVDKSFVRSIIYPIFKKGDKTLPNNYRGISFMNCLPKVMMGIVKDRLANWSEKHGKINEYQAGFRKNYSTVDNLFNLSSIIHLNWHKNKKTYAFFVDFKAAFDRVSRKAMIYKLHTIGVSTKARNSPVILIQPQVLNRAAYYLLSYLLCTSMTYMNTLVVVPQWMIKIFDF